MRVFQNVGLYPTYRRRLDALARGARSHQQRLEAFLGDRFGALHLLKPTLERDPNAFLTVGDDDALQRMWARDHGMPKRVSLDDILLAQIEHHRADVFYDMDPMRHPPAFMRRLPSCVRRRIGWRAAPSPGADFSGFDLMACNFPAILRSFEAAGLRSGYLSPAYDPAMDTYAADDAQRDVDVVFVGGYSRHHVRRARLLEAVAGVASHHRVAFHLDCSRLTRVAETPLGWTGPLRAHRRPRVIRRVARPPIFGIDLYRALGRAKIALNGAIDMAGDDRGNMRCFEAMGCGSLLLSDEGRYPDAMDPGRSLVTYRSPQDAVERILALLGDDAERRRIAAAGRAAVTSVYTKQHQWEAFVRLAH